MSVIIFTLAYLWGAVKIGRKVVYRMGFPTPSQDGWGFTIFIGSLTLLYAVTWPSTMLASWLSNGYLDEPPAQPKLPKAKALDTKTNRN